MVDLMRPSVALPPDQGPAPLPLPGGPFLLWPFAVVRGAGFPLTDLTQLGDERYLAAVDALLDAAGDPGAISASELRAAAEVAERRQQEMLREVARRSRFREAIAWQNHPVVAMIDSYADASPDAGRNHRLRKRERILARYWARFCAKNDTIGFFGPACWAEIRADGPPVTTRSGPALDVDRRVNAENWAVEALAATMIRDPALQRRLPPRPHPATHLEGPVLYRADGPAVMLTAAESAILSRCDGRREPADIARELLAAGVEGIAARSDVDAVLDDLATRKLIRRDLEPPLMARPEAHVRHALESLRPESDKALDILDRWDAARERVAAVPPADLVTALDELASTFVDITGEEPERRQGQTYGGRRLIYLDARRDLDVAIGPGVLDAIGPPLSALLQSGRWLTERIASTYRDIFTQAYTTLAEANPSRPILYIEMIYACSWAVFGEGPTPMDAIIDDFAKRWATLLKLDTDEKVVHVTADELRRAVDDEFGPTRPGWTQAHQHSVDVQLAGADTDAVGRGAFDAVLGEVHFAWNAVEQAALVGACADPAALERLVHVGLPGRRVTLVPVKQYPRISARTISALDGDDWQLSVTDDPGGVPARRIALASLIVEIRDGRLQVGTRGSGAGAGVWLDPIDTCGIQMAEDVTDAFKRVTKLSPHSPRVVVDRLVLCRETWNVRLGDIPLATGGSEAECFVNVRRWCRDLSLPRFVFVSLPNETKPFYVDFASSALVGCFATAVRQATTTAGADATAAISEMLPGPGQEWLPDAEGRRYTSELRLQLVDPAAP